MCRFRSALVLSSLAELQLCLLVLGALAAGGFEHLWLLDKHSTSAYNYKKLNFPFLCEASEVQRTVQQHSAER